MNYDSSHFDIAHDRHHTNSLKWDKYDADVLPLWVADMDFAMAPEIREAMLKRLEHPILGYTRASPELIAGLQSHLKEEYSWDIDEQWITWLPGVVAGLAACVRAYAGEGSEIITNPPIYHHFFQVHDHAKHKLVEVPLRVDGTRWTYDIEAMRKAVNKNTSLIMLCSPHNPTGTVFTADELKEICAIADSVGAVVASDEIHCGLVLNPETPHVPTAVASACPDSVVTLMSASKTFNLAGVNCSYAITPNLALREKFNAACAEVIPPVSTLSYTAAEAAFSSGQHWRNGLLDYLRGNYAYLQQEFAKIEGMELQSLDATYLAWIDATKLGLNDTSGFFESHGLGFSSGEQFGQPQFLRLNFACPRSTLEQAVERVHAALASLD